jgi:hypothetical protein
VHTVFETRAHGRKRGVPAFALVSQPQLIHEQQFARWIYPAGGFTTDRAFLVPFAVALMMVIVVSNTIPAVMM